MLLFLTRDARFRFSIDDRFAGDGEVSRSPIGFLFSLNRVGDAGSRFCQYWRGEFEANGDESKGEESPANTLFCYTSVSSIASRFASILTLVA